MLDAHAGLLCVDIESASACDIGFGSWAYSQHPSTRVYCAVFSYTTGLNKPRRTGGWRPGMPAPRSVVDFIRAGGTLLAHNCAFEQSMFANVPALAAFGKIEIEQWRDTQAMGCALNLPRSLDGLCSVLKVPHQKDMEGAALMKKMARAQVPAPAPGLNKLGKMLHYLNAVGPWEYPLATPANLDRLQRYCAGDVAATLDAYFAMAQLSVTELLVWNAHQRINARGALLDQEFAGKLQRMAQARQEQLQKETQRLTFFEMHKSTASPGLMKWLAGRGVVLPKRNRKKKDGSFKKTASIDRAAVIELLKDATLPAEVRAVLENRAEANKATSLAKLDRVEPMVGSDGRLRHALRYCGAHTGRWTSDGLQLHNLPKNYMTEETNALVRDLVEDEDIELLALLENRPLEALSQTLRSVIVAPAGKELIGADFSAIEARVCAWLAGQDDVVDFFFNFDAEKRAGLKPKKFYDFTAESIGTDDYQLGKIAALSLQYGMGDIRFAQQAAGKNVPLSYLQARKTKNAWRLANACIVKLWRDLEDAARAAIEKRGTVHLAGLLSLYASDSALFLTLPSGRALRYWAPSIVVKQRTFQVVDDEGNLSTQVSTREEIQFFKAARGVSMVPEGTYGGKLLENATQATARELLAEGLVRLDRLEPYELVMHVHDSAAAEVPEGKGDVQEVSDVLAATPAWAAGCPIAAEGWRDRRFRG